MKTALHASRPGPRCALAFVPGIAAILLAGSSAASGQDQPTGSWSGEQSGQYFYFGGSASDGTYLYIVGGYQYGVVTTYPQYYQQLRRYDPVFNSWTTLAPMSTPAYYLASAYYNGRLFRFGGYDTTSGNSAAIHAYNIASNSWTTLAATLSSARYILGAATLGDRIYITGGFSNAISAINDEFNPVNDTVTTRASMPGGLYYHAMAAVPAVNRAYALCGYTQSGPVAVTYEFTPPSAASPNGSWSVRSPLQNAAGQQQPRYGSVAFSLIDRVYVTGGYSNGYQSATWEYDPAADSWAQRASMANARYLHAAAAVGDRGYVYGGIPTYTTGEEFTPPVFNQPPTADAGPDQEVECSGQEGTDVALDGTGSTDPDGDDLTYDWEGPFGAASGPNPTVTLPLGTSEITLTVTDPSGETSTDSVSVTVVDTTAPVIESVSASPDTLWPPNNQMREVSVAATANDICDPSPECEILSVSSNQDEGSDPDWEITGALTLKLRAQRSGDGARVYTITVRCVDASGNSSTATVEVTVPHSQGN